MYKRQDYNTIFVDLQMAGISCYQNFLRAVIDSNYAKEFNPYTCLLYTSLFIFLSDKIN